MTLEEFSNLCNSKDVKKVLISKKDGVYICILKFENEVIEFNRNNIIEIFAVTEAFLNNKL